MCSEIITNFSIQTKKGGFAFSYVDQAILWDPAISNTQGKQKLVRYIKGLLYPNVY